MEQVADNNLILVLITKVKDNIKTCEWMWAIHKSVLKNIGVEIPEIFSETHLNVRYSMYEYARESHDMKKLDLVSSIMASNCASVSYLVLQIKPFIVTMKEIGT